MKFLIPYLLFTVGAYSQSHDSIIQFILELQNDTERVNLLYKEGFNLRNKDPKLAYQYALICYDEALKANQNKHLAKSYNLLGILNYKKANYRQAIFYQKKALELNVKISNISGIAINETNLGNIYNDINQFDLAEKSYLKALHAYKMLNSADNVAKCLSNIGILKFNQQQFIPAINQFKQALAIAEQNNNIELMALCYNNIGTTLTNLNQLDTAILYLDESVKIKKRLDNEFELADSYNNLAFAYSKLGNFKQADYYINLTQQLCNELEYTDAEIELAHTRYVFYTQQKNFEQANSWLVKHHQKKDSVKATYTIFNDDDDLTTDNKSLLQNKKTSKQNKWLFVFIILFVIFVPLQLLKFKR